MPIDSATNLTFFRRFSKAWKVCVLACIFATALARAEQPAELTQALQHVESENYEQAFPVIRRFAREGNPRAQGMLARMYLNGWGTQEDGKEGFYWAQRGAQQNDPGSLWAIGYIYWQGFAGFDKDTSKAVRWIERAAEAGYVRAMSGMVDVCMELKRADCVLSWGTKAFEVGEKNIAYRVANWLRRAEHLPDQASRAKKWAHMGAVAGDPDSMALYGSLLWNSTTGHDLQIEEEALRWFKKAASTGSASGHYRAGEAHLFGHKELLSSEKAIKHLGKAADLGHSDALYLLTRAYLTGEYIIPSNSELGYAKLKQLRASSGRHLSLDIESLLYLNGVDRPRNIRRAALLGLKAMQIEWQDLSTRHLGFDTGEHLLRGEAAVFGQLGMPDHYILAWARFLYGKHASLWYEDFKAAFAPAAVVASEVLSFDVLLRSSISFLEKRAVEFGPIEASDLIDEGWNQFIGLRGPVNEPLAQLLIEEGLRLAIRKADKAEIATARSYLGIILFDSYNERVKNEALAKVHFDDAEDDLNLLWLNYLGLIHLTQSDVARITARYEEEEREPHRTTSLPPLTRLQKANLMAAAEMLASLHKDGDDELAFWIGNIYETMVETPDRLKKAASWYSRTGDYGIERKLRVEKILRGEYEGGMPNFTGTVYQLFEVDLVTTRGGLLTDLKSAISERLSAATKTKKGSLNLYALVLGNASYQKDPLKNSVNDAVAVAKKLRALGFKVTEALNRDRRGFRDVLMRFSETTKDADVTVFYYSGHGMQLGGVNYLLPVDLDFSMPRSVVTYDGMSLNDIKNRSLNGATKLIFLDACRNNPFEQVTRGGRGRGLAPMNVGTGTLISFATKDGSVAFDGVGGEHSPYTDALLRHIDREEDIEIMLRSVGDEVMRMTNKMQQPWKYGALSGEKVILPLLAR